MIDIIVTISTAVGTGFNFPHCEVGTKFHHIRTYNRLTINHKLKCMCALSHQILINDTFQDKLKPHVQTETRRPP